MLDGGLMTSKVTLYSSDFKWSSLQMPKTMLKVTIQKLDLSGIRILAVINLSLQSIKNDVANFYFKKECTR
jgi:hypothetical protein